MHSISFFVGIISMGGGKQESVGLQATRICTLELLVSYFPM